MPHPFKKLEHEAIELLNRRAKKKSKLSYKKQVAMLDDIFKGLVPYIFEGFIVKASHDIGEFCLGICYDYNFHRPLDIHHKFNWEKTHNDPDGRYHKRTYSRMQYFLYWVPGERMDLMPYYLKHSPSFDKKLHKRIVEGGNLFPYEKTYRGLTEELENTLFYYKTHHRNENKNS